MSNVSVEYLVLRDNVEYSRLTAFKGGGAAISVTAVAYTGPWCRSTRAQLSSPGSGA